MEFDEVVLGRRSIRGYKQEPVPKEVIEEVLELAIRSPSSMNTQPWHLYVVTGEALDKIRKYSALGIYLSRTQDLYCDIKQDP